MIKINHKNILIETFVSGETKIKIDPLVIEFNKEPYISIEFRYESDADIFHLITVKDFVDNHNFNNKPVILKMEYIPYSRTDSGHQLLSLQSFSKIINNLNFSEIQVLEPHSEVSVALFKRINVAYTSVQLALIAIRDLMGLSGYFWITNQEGRQELLEKAKKKGVYIIYPDIEAYRRYNKLIEYDNVLLCEKTKRKTSETVNFKILGGPVSKNCKMVVVIDDLCTPNENFHEIAKQIADEEIVVDKAVLCVTHCEPQVLESKIFEDELFDKFYISDSMFDKYDFEQTLKNKEIEQKVAIIEGSKLRQLK